MNSTFASLRFFNYRLWFAGALVSNVGTWMQRIAQDWLVLTVLSDDSGIAVGVVTALQFAPYLVLSPWAGTLADRLDHRRLLMFTQAGAGTLAFGLGGIVLLGHAQLWHLYVFALLLGCVTSIDGPVRQAFVSELVPKAYVPNAVGLNSTSFHSARLIGPGVAGLLLAWVGAGWVFSLNGLTFVATVVALRCMRTDQLVRGEKATRQRGRIREGFRYVKSRGDIVLILVVVGVVSMFGLNFQLTSALMARTEFDKGPGEYGILGSILAVGSLLGALIAARRKIPRVRIVVGSAFLFGIATGALALMPTYHSFAVVCIPVGLAIITMMTAANATIQTTTPANVRGRVMAVYMMVFLGSTPVGSPIVGWVGDTFGARWSIGIGAIASLLVAIGAAAWVLRHWNLRVRYSTRRPFFDITYPEPEAER
jgi:MFS family permease